MKNVIVILFISVIAIFCNAQKPMTISGCVRDKNTGKGIKNVNVLEKNTNNCVKTNSIGLFKITIIQSSATIAFTHVSYFEKKVSVNNDTNLFLQIELQTRTTNLKEVSINVQKPISITADLPLYVKDYDFYGDSILLLAYRDKHISTPELIVMNRKGKNISRTIISNPEKLYKDCLGNLHLIEKDNAFQIYLDSNGLNLIYPNKSDGYEVMLSPCVQELKEKYFLKSYAYNSQILNYYWSDLTSQKPSLFFTISDEKAIRRLRDKNRLLSMQGVTDADVRFEEMCFYAPLYAPLIKVNDTILIFNFVDEKIEFLNQQAEIIKAVPVKFQNDKKWKKQLFVDDVKNKVYTLFLIDGISKLYEINLQDGSIVNPISIPDFVYVENIKVHDGKIYFLYTNKNSDAEYKQLYSFKI